MQRSKRYQITYEVLNAVTHGLGFFLAVIAGIALIFHVLRRPVTAFEMTAIVIYILVQLASFYSLQHFFILSYLHVLLNYFSFLITLVFIWLF